MRWSVWTIKFPDFLTLETMMNLTRRTLIAATALAAFALAPFTAHAAPVIGEAAPAFTDAVDANGNTHSLSDFAGKTVVLEWTNHDCPYVKKHYSTDNMQTLQRNAVADGVVWLQIISSAEGKQGHVSGEKALELNEKRGAAPTATLIDASGVIGGAYEAATTPHMFVINPEGTLVYKGAIDDNSKADPKTVDGATNYVAAALDAVKSGTTPAITDTTPYGCSVKY
jgi:peroxiredoxin